MKRIIVFCLLGLIAFNCVAFALQNGAAPVSGSREIQNLTLTTAGVVYSMTLATYETYSINLQAIGGDIYMSIGGTSTEAKWTIQQNSALWDHLPMPLAKATVLYFWAPTSGVTLEMFRTKGA